MDGRFIAGCRSRCFLQAARKFEKFACDADSQVSEVWDAPLRGPG